MNFIRPELCEVAFTSRLLFHFCFFIFAFSFCFSFSLFWFFFINFAACTNVVCSWIIPYDTNRKYCSWVVLENIYMFDICFKCHTRNYIFQISHLKIYVLNVTLENMCFKCHTRNYIIQISHLKIYVSNVTQENIYLKYHAWKYMF